LEFYSILFQAEYIPRAESIAAANYVDHKIDDEWYSDRMKVWLPCPVSSCCFFAIMAVPVLCLHQSCIRLLSVWCLCLYLFWYIYVCIESDLFYLSWLSFVCVCLGHPVSIWISKWLRSWRWKTPGVLRTSTMPA
jgi:hypothetical protein